MRNFFYILLVTVVLLASSMLPLLSQTYLHEPTIWKEYLHGSFNYPILTTHDYNIELKGDTIIDGKVYFKTLKIGMTTFAYPNGDSIEVPIYEYSYPIREEDQKFYIYKEQKDYLLHNFNLAVGDTAVAEVNCNYKTVVWIDTVYVGNIPRKRFHFNGPYDIFTLIEGVGPSRGLFRSPCNQLGIQFQLKCFIQDQSYLQVNSGYDCSSLVSTENYNDTHFKIYPNPFTEELSIQFPDSFLESVSIRIANLLGTIVYQSAIDYPESLERINLENLPSGMYVVWIRTKDVETSYKVIKQ